MRRKLGLALLTVFIGGYTYGQTFGNGYNIDSHNRWRDTYDRWHINLSAGENLYFGEGDSKLHLGKRITPSYEFSVTNVATPIISFRALFSRGKIFGMHAMPYNPQPGEVGDYERFSLTTFQLHTMFDLINAFSKYRGSHKDHLKAFIGFGGAMGRAGDIHSKEIIIVGGIANQLYLSDKFDLTGELRHMFVNPRMNNYVESGKYYEGMVTLSIGLNYKFGNFRNMHSPMTTSEL